jgi:hypothetical protein
MSRLFGIWRFIIITTSLFVLFSVPLWGKGAIGIVLSRMGYTQHNISNLSASPNGVVLYGVDMASAGQKIRIEQVDLQAFPQPSLKIDKITITSDLTSLRKFHTHTFSPFSSVIVKNIKLHLHTPYGPFHLIGEAALQGHNDSHSFQADFNVDQADMRCDLTIHGRKRQNLLTWTARIDDGRVEKENIKATRITAAATHDGSHTTTQLVAGNVILKNMTLQDVNIAHDTNTNNIVFNAKTSDQITIAGRINSSQKTADVIISAPNTIQSNNLENIRNNLESFIQECCASRVITTIERHANE